MNTLQKRYGLITAICMVVGIVIGSGVFFKAQDVLYETGGNMLDGILAWLIGGAIMIVLAATFAVMATKYERVGGVVDYAEATCGKTYAYFVGWFLSLIYYPAMTSVLAWVSARYTMVAVFGYPSASPDALYSPECITIAVFYLIFSYFVNALSPKLAGKIQVSTTVIKLIPLIFIALVGTVIGIINGRMSENLNYVQTVTDVTGGGGLFTAICSTAFAYEGWIIATTINAEIKNAKRNLPIALVGGAIITVLIYTLYYVGVLGLESSSVLISEGTSVAFKYFGDGVATLINFLIIISCLGTLNGLMVATTRSTYALSARGEGISPRIFSQVDKETNMPHNSAALGLLICTVWFVYFIGGQFFGWFGEYAFDSSELPIITVYPLYLPMLIRYMIKEKELGAVKRFVLPALSIAGVAIMVTASILRHKMDNLWYLIVFAAVMLGGMGVLLYNKTKKNQNQ